MNKTMDSENPTKDFTKTDSRSKSRREAWWDEQQLPYTENRVLRIVTIILAIGFIIVLVALYIKAREGNMTSSNVCMTKNCIETAADILSKLDTTKQPCDSFYDFACGTFVKNYILPEDKSVLTPLSYARDVLTEKLRVLVDEEPLATDTKSTGMVRSLFKSCMNKERLNRDGIQPLQRILKELGGWPVVEGDSWNVDNFDFFKMLYKMREFGFSTDYYFTFSVISDMKNSSWRIIGFDQAELGMPSRDYMVKGLNDSDVQAYYQYQVDLAVAVGADPGRARREMRDNVQFEIDIANVTLPEADRRDIEKLYNKMTLRDLTSFVPSFPWLEITNKFLDTNITVTLDEPITVSVPGFMQFIASFVSSASKRTLANNMLWHVAAMTVPYLPKNIRAIELKYTSQISGVAKEAPRWKDCMDLVSEEIPFAVGALYVKNFFNEKSKDEAENMVRYIHMAFNKNLNRVRWMDEQTKAQAIIKSKAIKPLIGYPSEILNETLLMDFYSGLKLTDGELLSNIGNISLYKRRSEHKLLREKVVKSDWKIYGDAAVVNAFYSPVDNAILFPAGILQGIFFDADRPKYLNYGSIGFVIGHEITHGFDDEGSQFNENGDLTNWWQPETRKKFLNKSKCIVDQYSNYSVPEIDLNLNGVVTQGENIADNGGIKGAYHAYEQWAGENGEEQVLPGLPYTQRQMFWISSAHLWCSKARREYLKLSVMSKLHSLPRYRINGPMSNLPEFSRDWQCPKGSYMNPDIKCTVW